MYKVESIFAETVDDLELEARKENGRRKERKAKTCKANTCEEIETRIGKLEATEERIRLDFEEKLEKLEETIKTAEKRVNETLEAAEEKSECRSWHLGMNLNPADGHIMNYLTGWHTGENIGTPATALSRDFLNSLVWREPASYIAIARHQQGTLDAVKVFKFTSAGPSLLDRFQMMNPGRIVVTEGGPIQEDVLDGAMNLEEDPIFSVGGDLAFNWVYGDNGVRVVLTGGYLSDSESGNTNGLGKDLLCECRTRTSTTTSTSNIEISNIQDGRYSAQGTDHGTNKRIVPGPVFGNYAIFVSRNADSFPSPGTQLQQNIEVCA